MNFYDLVHCQTIDGYSCLSIAPAWNCLEAGDIVRVDDNSEMKIVKICTAGISNKTYEFMRNSGVEIKRIMSKVLYEAMNYSEEPDDDDDCGVSGAEVSE